MSAMQSSIVPKAKAPKIVRVVPAAQPLKKAAMPPPPASPSPVLNNWLVQAKAVLAKAGKPLHYKEITAQAIAGGLETSGKTPDRTMCSKLFMSVKNGEGFFKKTGDGMFALV
jgi:hypothetical protein